MKNIMMILVLAAGFIAGCNRGSDTDQIQPTPSQAEASVTNAPDVDAEPVATPTSEKPTPDFEGLTYTDGETGFTFLYPPEWESSSQVEQYPRGEIAQLYLNGEPVLTISKLKWDPQGDLDAYVDTRITAWLNSEVEILSDEVLPLNDGTEAHLFTVEGIDGVQSLFLMAELGDRYLVLSGDGDLEILRQVMTSLEMPGLDS